LSILFETELLQTHKKKKKKTTGLVNKKK